MIAHVETDEVHKWLRTDAECDVNDRTRAIFRAAIANIFGGEDRIPASVKKAMLMGDYDHGKPLTARRIMAVKAAIDADGSSKARSEKIRLETFSPAASTRCSRRSRRRPVRRRGVRDRGCSREVPVLRD